MRTSYLIVILLVSCILSNRAFGEDRPASSIKIEFKFEDLVGYWAISQSEREEDFSESYQRQGATLEEATTASMKEAESNLFVVTKDSKFFHCDDTRSIDSKLVLLSEGSKFTSLKADLVNADGKRSEVMITMTLDRLTIKPRSKDPVGKTDRIVLRKLSDKQGHIFLNKLLSSHSGSNNKQ